MGFISFYGFTQKALSLEEALEIAQRQNLGLQTQNLIILQNADNFRNFKKNQYPSVSANVSQSLNGGRSIDPFSNTFIQRTIGSNSYGISTNMTLFNGFSYRYQLARSKNTLESEQLKLLFDKKALKINVTEAYMQVLLAQELVKIAYEQKLDLEKQIIIIKEKVKEGILPTSHILDFEAQIANLTFEEFAAKNRLDLSKINLNNWLGNVSKADFDVKFQNVVSNKSAEFNAQHPSLKIGEKRVLGANLETKIAEAAKYPKINLNGGLGSAYSSAAASEFNYFNQLNYNLNQYLSLGIIIPIYTNGQVQNKISNARIQEQIVKKESDNEKLKLNQEYEQQKLEIALLKEKLKYAETNLVIQNKVYVGAKERFSEGLISSLELNTFRFNAEKAKISFSQNQIELTFKMFLLEVFLE